MANNHAADFGDAVFAQTLAARRGAPIPIVGVGRDEAEAFTPLRVDVHGVSVAVLASSQIRDVTSREHAAGPSSPGIATNLDPARCAGRCGQRRRLATSSSSCCTGAPSTRAAPTTGSARRRGCSPPTAPTSSSVATPTGRRAPAGLGQAYVAYGLGNFVWYNNEGAAADTGVLTVTVDAAAAAPAGAHSAGPVGRGRRVVADAHRGRRGAACPLPRVRPGTGSLAGWDAATRCARLSRATSS